MKATNGPAPFKRGKTMIKPLSNRRKDLFWLAVHLHGFDGNILDFPGFPNAMITIDQLTRNSDDMVFYTVLCHVIQGVIKQIKLSE